jgi:hypothetical protein
MTARLPVRARRCDIRALHATIASVSALQGERRTLYQFAADLLQGDHARILDPDIIDSPLARSSIGDALAGRSGFSDSTLVGISAVAEPGGTTPDLPVASRPEANALLAGALAGIGAELGSHQAATGPPRVLTAADGEQFTAARTVLHAGIELARSVSPELIEDLLPHIALVAFVDPRRAGGLASASSRTFPGLIIMESPRASIEVAEALVHEGAHQKLFDLAITHDLLSVSSDRCPPFHPPWAPEEHRWPIEQTLAACHAYACLARFSEDASLAGRAVVAGASSLLPVAGERSEIIGQWLLGHGDHLGVDAHTLLEGLLGRRPRTTDTAQNRSCGPPAADYVIAAGWEMRRCHSSDRVLLGRPARPPQLYWVSQDAATVLGLLGHKPLGEIVDTFAHSWRVPPVAATERLTALLSDLHSSGLVTPKVW